MSTASPFEYRASTPARLASEGAVVMADVSAESGAPTCAASMRIDTGTATSRLSDEVAKKLSLVPIADGADAAASQCPIYEVHIAIRRPDGHGIIGVFEARVAGTPKSDGLDPDDGVLGRDFLHNIKVTYDGRTGSFQLVNAIDEARKLQAVVEQREAKRRTHAKRKQEKANSKKGRRKRKKPAK